MKKTPHNEPPIGLTLGDPAGIGPECAFASLSHRNGSCLLIAGEILLECLIRRLGLRVRLHRIINPGTDPLAKGCINFFDPGISLPRSSVISMIIPGRPTRTSAWLSFHYLESAVTLALNGKISGLVTGPVSKEGIRNAGIKGFRGQTEYLAERDGGKTVCMAFAGEKTVVGLATTHCSLKQVSSALDRKDLAQKIELLEAFCRRAYGPRTMTALLSLNPHAGEHGLFGMEEMRLLNPLIRDLRKNGRKIEGPFPSDAFWSRRGLWKRFRAVLAMYHDQGLIPVKSGLLGRTVHTTLGLSFLRFSADHGTAFDIAGKGKADWTDTAYALDRAEELARKR